MVKDVEDSVDGGFGGVVVGDAEGDADDEWVSAGDGLMEDEKFGVGVVSVEGVKRWVVDADLVGSVSVAVEDDVSSSGGGGVRCGDAVVLSGDVDGCFVGFVAEIPFAFFVAETGDAADADIERSSGTLRGGGW